MQGVRKSKRVTWASDVNLCQMRLFLSEDSPSQVGLGAQDHLQAKASWTLHSDGVGSDDNLPPGFEGIQPVGVLKNKLAQIPVIKWRRPAIFVLDPNWRVVAGEESKEVDVQKQREMRMLEAIYPRPSAIPPNPILIGADESFHSDQHTPIIPITPIEEEDATADLSYHGTTITNGPLNSPALQMAPPAFSSQSLTAASAPAHGMPASGVAPAMEPNLVAAAQAALAAAMSTNDQGNLIDPDLLLRILSDPQMIEQLVRNHGVSSGTQNLPAVSTPNIPVITMPNVPRAPGRHSAERPPVPHNRIEPPPAHVSRPELVGTSVAAASNAPLYPPSRIGSLPNLRPAVPDTSVPSSSAAPAAKDINYYKSLIQQHGGERQDNLPQFSSGSNHHIGLPPQVSVNNSKLRDSKPKIMKPCMFHNTARGCRNGANCAFQHDSTQQQRVNPIPDLQNTKRVKMDSKINGT